MPITAHTSPSLPVIAIVGPTASGKTALATALVTEIAQRYPDICTGFDFISADSRQVYQGLEITTGCDIPAASQQKTLPDFSYPFFEQTLSPEKTLRWHGFSIISPYTPWSVADCTVVAQEVISQSLAQKRVVCIIGGTGLYHQAIANPSLQDVFIKPDATLRATAETLSLSELQQWLATTDPTVFAHLNESDRANPRRLIRHLEKALYKQTHPEAVAQQLSLPYQLHTFGIKTNDIDDLATKIEARVKQRIELGALQEVAALDFAALDPQARTTLGLREIKGFLESQYDLHALEQIWSLHEKQYAKRQLTWWKKQPAIQWLEAISPSLLTDLAIQIMEMTAAT